MAGLDNTETPELLSFVSGIPPETPESISLMVLGEYQNIKDYFDPFL